MSSQVNLASYLDGSGSPNLFHTSLGKVNALSGILHLHRDVLDNEPPDVVSANLAALLHERHHWVQSLATDAGIFHMLLLELQATVITSTVPIDELTADQLPLLTQFSGDKQILQHWEHLEAVRRTIFGCRKADLQDFIDRKISPFPYRLVDLIQEVLFGILGTPPDNPVRQLWERLLLARDEKLDGMPELPGLPGLLGTQSGSLLGAKHLMECSARIAESIKLSTDWIRRKTGEDTYDMTSLFTGIYGEALAVSQKVSDRPLNFITLAYACDYALCSAYPPVLPPTRALLHPGWLPGVRFAQIIRHLSDFDDSESVNFGSADQVRERIRQMDTFMADRMPFHGTEVLVTAMAALAIPPPDELAGDLFTTSEGGSIPVPTTPGGRFRYWLSLAAEACRMRVENPEFIIFPAPTYLDSRPNYHSMFDRIQPPLLSYGQRGIAGTRNLDGWLLFFLSAAFEYELVRAIVYADVHQLATQFLDYFHGLAGFSNGPEVFEYLLRNACRDAPFVGPLLDEVRALSRVG